MILGEPFSLGLGESYFFLFQCFLKIRDLLKVLSTHLEIPTESMTTLIYPKTTNPSTMLIMFRGLLPPRILFLFHKYTIEAISPHFTDSQTGLSTVPQAF